MNVNHRSLREIEHEIAERGADLAAIQRARDAEAKAAADKRAAAEKIDADKRDAADKLAAEIEALQNALANDLGVPVQVAYDELRARAAAAAHLHGERVRIFAPLINLFVRPHSGSMAKPDAAAAREARFCAAAAGVLPPVPKGSVWGTEKDVRVLPPHQLGKGTAAHDAHVATVRGAHGLRAVCEALGIPTPVERKPTCETVAQAVARLPRADASPWIGADDDRRPADAWPRGPGIAQRRADAEARAAEREEAAKVDMSRDRELALVKARHDLERSRCRLEHHEACHALRVRIVEALDRVLADLELGQAYFFTRHLRRYVAAELPVKLTDPNDLLDLSPDHLFRNAIAAGARINVSLDKDLK